MTTKSQIDDCRERPTPTSKVFEKDLILSVNENETNPKITYAPRRPKWVMILGAVIVNIKNGLWFSPGI